MSSFFLIYLLQYYNDIEKLIMNVNKWVISVEKWVGNVKSPEKFIKCKKNPNLRMQIKIR